MSISRRCIGLDVHRDFAQVAIWQGGVVTQEGRFATTPEEVRAFANRLAPTDEVALEATGNTWAIAALLASCAARVVVSNPAKTRAIAEAKIKTDLLTELSAGTFGRCGRRPFGLARFASRDQRRGWATGVVWAGGASAGVA